MSWFAEARHFAWLFTVFAIAACSADHPCTPETCDGRDNDCDGHIDEGFLNASGQYMSLDNCGSCGVACAAVFPTAATTACVSNTDVAPECQIVSCKAGDRLAGDGACVSDTPVLCLPCASDDECALRSTDARCLPAAGSGMRCGRACSAASDCPTGFACTDVAGGKAQCTPNGGSCACTESMVGADFACELSTPIGEQVCAGVQHCSASRLSECEAALAESCNGLDDDCDGAIDETFKDASGLYIGVNNCGGCGKPCTASGPHRPATCAAVSGVAKCTTGCEPGFVDVDGIATNGCECQLSTGHAPVVGGDSNCDGVIDDTPGLVFVSQAGDDANDGSDPSAPVRSIARGMTVGAMLGHSVLVARGIYSGSVTLVDGVTLVGGYSPDFRAHDPELYPVMLEADGGAPGAPVLRCQNNTKPIYVEGLTIAASDAVGVGQGSTAIWLSGCDSQLELNDVTVLAGRGANGEHGADSSDRLSGRGLSTLADLSGFDGSPGANGGQQGCATVTAGSGGVKSCGVVNVSGGDGGSAQCAAISCSNDGTTKCGNAGCTDFTQAGVCDIAAARSAAVANPSPTSGQGSAPGSAAEATYDAPTNHATCTFCDDNPSLPRVGGAGGDGLAGAPGAAGGGCTGALNLDSLGRVSSSAGGMGSDGTNGSGGGGGSAGSGFAAIGGTSGSCTSVAGSAGGGAGSGGCSAPGAAGGGSGGASIGIVIQLANGASLGPRLTQVRIVTASGGDGGDGGVGASGGKGGFGGLGGVSDFWCARNGGRGGDGGPGGAAGGGGGGCGGASLGVYLVPNSAELSGYSTSLMASSTIEIAGAAGRGGRGGFSPGLAGGAGFDGAASSILTGTR